MVKIKELNSTCGNCLVCSRIVMPISLEEYQVAQMYMVTRMQQQSKTGTEGVEVLENRPAEDEVFGHCRYTSKVYRLQSKLPSWMTTFASRDALVLQEESWYAFPRCKTVLKCPHFTKFSLTIETFNKADHGKSENVHSLDKDKLAAREVELVDIASAGSDYWSYAVGSNTTDLSQFKSSRTGRGPLLNGWQKECSPVMTAYKLVTIDAPYWGFGYKIEQALLAAEKALFLESHRNSFSWIDEWFGMTLEDIRDIEMQMRSSSNQMLSLPNLPITPDEFDQRFVLDAERRTEQEVTI